MFNKSPSLFDGIAEAFRSTYATPLKDGNEIAVYIGTQEAYKHLPSFHMFNLTRDVGEYPQHSTVGVETLARLGYSMPTIPDANDSRSYDDAGEPLCSL